MNRNSLNLLGNLGELLDRDIFPDVMNGGIVKVPHDPVPFSFTEGTSKCYGKLTRRSQPGSWEGSTGWQGSSRGQGSAQSANSTILSGIRSYYQENLKEVCHAYPSTWIWHQTDNIWLRTKSSILEGVDEFVIFILQIPITNPLIVKGWGFWNGATWIGPRHTNFPDGSICAFEPKDNTWCYGDTLVDLIDLYSVWVLRHLYLREFGRWPGRQSSFCAYERLMEFLDEEFCGCGSDKPYASCHKSSDLKSQSEASESEFKKLTAGGSRLVPKSVIDLNNLQIPPSNSDSCNLYRKNTRAQNLLPATVTEKLLSKAAHKQKHPLVTT